MNEILVEIDQKRERKEDAVEGIKLFCKSRNSCAEYEIIRIVG